MKLVNPTDRELDETFATEIAGWRRDPGYDGKWIPAGKPALSGGNYYTAKPPAFTQSADAVLPWLQKWKAPNPEFRSIEIYDHISGRWLVKLMERAGHGEEWRQVASVLDDLPRAAVLALLSAHGVEVGFAP